jgi:hypothetical protein
VAESPYPDDVSSLARDLTARVEALCPHVPVGELAELTSQLALAEYAHASGVSFGGAELESSPAPLGNRIVWLPGSAASAIVLPAGEDSSGANATAAQILDWARRRANPARGVAARGLSALRQFRSALVSAHQDRPRTE